MIDRQPDRHHQPHATVFQAVLLLTLIETGVLASCFFQKPTAGYRSLTIEHGTLHAEWSDPVFAQLDADDRVLPVVGDYFFPFQLDNGDFTINHLSQKDAHSSLIRYTYLGVGANHNVGHLVKTREVLNGAFGEVFATKSCYYVPPEQWAQWPNRFDVQSYSEVGEPPSVHSEKPARAVDTLFYLSVIRVFRAAPEYVVVSAVYSSDGRLRSVYINGSKGGDWIHTNYLTGFEKDAVSLGKERAPETLRHYGLPDRLDVNRYQRKFDFPLAKPALESVTDAVNLHFNFGEWARQDEFGPDGSHQTRYFTYVQTDEDRILEPICNQRFAEQFKKGIDPPY
jgi:hypothetical protein